MRGIKIVNLRESTARSEDATKGYVDSLMRSTADQMDMGGQKITNVGKSTDDNDAATHGYVNARFSDMFGQAMAILVL